MGEVLTNQQTDQDADLLGRWVRERGFGRSIDRWWLAPVNHTGSFTPQSFYADPGEVTVSAHGREILEVLDVTDGFVQYRHYVLNPAGVRVSWRVVPQIDDIETRTAYQLRKKLKRLKMQREEEPAAQHPAASDANVIQFPAHRIVRRAGARMSDYEQRIADDAKVRRRERNRQYSHDQRRRLGKPTRAQYLASVKSKQPWLAEGISRTTWFRRRKAPMSQEGRENR
jgi:hypothetical protein